MTQVISHTQNRLTLTNPFSMMSLIYLSIASIGAFLSFLSIIDVYNVNGIEWIRVHLITLGTILQFLFGYLPRRVTNNDSISTRWDIFFVFNIGILMFLTGRYSQINSVMLIGGITLFLATLLLFHQLYTISIKKFDFTTGTIFYLTGIAYFFIGIIMGTGIWLGWSQELKILNILEVHIHANNWGLLSFVFAGLFLDKFEEWFGTPLRNVESFKRIYFLLLIGTFGLVVGPWTGSKIFLVPGLIAHLIGTIMLLRSIFLPLRDNIKENIPALHLFTGYLWFFAPVLVAPLILAGVPGIPGIIIEQRAPEALIFGWALQIILIVSFYFKRGIALTKTKTNYASLILFNIGALSLWMSIFTSDFLYGIAYLLWSIAIGIFAVNGWKQL